MKNLKFYAKAELCLVAISLLSILTRQLGYQFRPLSYTALAIIIALLYIAMSISAIKSRKSQNKADKIIGASVPIISVLFCISMGMVLQTNAHHVSLPNHYLLILAIPVFIMTIIVFICSISHYVLKTLAIIFSTLVSILFAWLLLIAFTIGNLGHVDSTEENISPDGKYESWINIVDEGALGYDFYVYARELNKDKFILIGTLMKADTCIDSIASSSGVSIEWQDGNMISVGHDGQRYYVPQYLEERRKYKNILRNLSNTLKIDLSEGNILIYEDTHGGFHGDGNTFAEISFSEDISHEFAENDKWKPFPLTENLNTAIYGKKTENEHWNPVISDKNGNSRVPKIKEGYYYFYDRHSESTNPYDDTDLFNRYSYNYTLAVYDTINLQLYYIKNDT